LRTRSEVIGLAIRELQKLELEQCYREANAEIDEAFEVTDGDGLENEAW
jgi:antitoxin ParD1/3/4